MTTLYKFTKNFIHKVFQSLFLDTSKPPHIRIDKWNSNVDESSKKLIDHLIAKYDLQSGQNLLELGPARGDFLKEFSNQNLIISAVDISDYVKEYCPNVNFKSANLEKEKIPFEDNKFDIV